MMGFYRATRGWSMRAVALLVTLLLLLLMVVPATASASAIGGAAPARQITPLTGVAVPITGLLAMLFLASVGERLSEYFIKPLIVLVSESISDPRLKKWADYVERLICAIPGGGMVILLKIDIFAFLGLRMLWPWGMIITAFVVGGGANLVHAFIKAIPDNSSGGVSDLMVAGDTHI